MNDDWQFSDEARDAGRNVPDLDEKALAGFCPDCHFAWTIHDSRMVGPIGGWKPPFGCPPSEVDARERWGR